MLFERRRGEKDVQAVLSTSSKVLVLQNPRGPFNKSLSFVLVLRTSLLIPVLVLEV